QLPGDGAVLADHEAGPLDVDAEQELEGAEVAVGQPQVAALNQGQDVGQEGAFLGLAVLGEEDGGDGHGGLVEDDQGRAGQGGGPGGAQLLEAVLGGGEVVAVEDLGVVALQPGGQGAQGADDGGGAAGGVGDEGGGDGQLQALELVVQGGVGDGEGVAE